LLAIGLLLAEEAQPDLVVAGLGFDLIRSLGGCWSWLSG